MKESNPLSKKGRKRRGRTNFSHSSYYNVLRATKGELEARSRNWFEKENSEIETESSVDSSADDVSPNYKWIDQIPLRKFAINKN